MSDVEWYQKGYIGKSPPVQVKFPRPLYPPDAKAKGKTPSKDGPDVLAYKRAICHAGRWGAWAPDTWDDTFSNAFSHGKSGNVKDTGIAGFQRQQGLDATGWVGQKTFDNMRYATISDPNAEHFGEPILDSVCVDLLNQAYEIYKGQAVPPPPPAPEKTPRQKALDHMAKRLGYTEQPANSNCDERSDGIRTAQDHCAGGGTWLRYQPWCGCWCYYAMETAGVERMDSSLASVSQIQQYAKSASKCYKGWTTDRSKVKIGDLVTMGHAAHVEMVRGFDGSNTLTYGGNTSAGTSGSQSNGGGAYARTRYPGEIDGYALVRYPGE